YVLLNQAVADGVGVLRDTWQANGWTGAPPPAATVAGRERAEIGEREDRRQAEYVAALFAGGGAAGTKPAAAGPPPGVPGESYLTTRNRWVGGATGPEDAAARQALWRAAQAYEGGVNRALSAQS